MSGAGAGPPAAAVDPDGAWRAAGAGDFVGAKAAVFIGDRLLCLLRDDTPGLAYANHWDFPGGGREAGESPFATLAREMEEEVGLDAHDADVLWHWHGESTGFPGRMAWFFVLRLPPGAERNILMGDEGGAWSLMPPARFDALDDAVPSLQARLRMWQAAAEAGHGDG